MDHLRMLEERKKLGISQKELADKLNVSQKSISKYERGTRRPSYETLSKMAAIFGVSVDYLLGVDREDFQGIPNVFGYPGEDENATTFPQKLAIQMEYNCLTIKEVAEGIGVSEEKILAWLTGGASDYEPYYKKLSAFFNVLEYYWITPHAISPGIVPNIDEYFLILTMRDYLKTGSFHPEFYGNLETYFPGILVTSNDSEKKLLTSFRELSEDNKDILIGDAKKYLREQRRESVAADQKLRQAK